jgi:hypothetical protein
LRKNEKTALAMSGLFFLGRIVPTEVCTVRTFWRNLMSRVNGVSRDFSRISPFIINHLEKAQTFARNGKK